jgi:flagellar biosynthesis/type III secretory pathway chaperone
MLEQLMYLIVIVLVGGLCYITFEQQDTIDRLRRDNNENNILFNKGISEGMKAHELMKKQRRIYYELNERYQCILKEKEILMRDIASLSQDNGDIKNDRDKITDNYTNLLEQYEIIKKERDKCEKLHIANLLNIKLIPEEPCLAKDRSRSDTHIANQRRPRQLF